MEIAVTIAVIIVGLGALSQIRTDPRITKEFLQKSYIAMGLYILFAACGVFGFIVLPIVTGDGTIAVFSIIGFFFWIALGVVWLIRLAPRLRELPDWLLRPWTALDWGLIVLILACVLAAFLL